MGCRALGGYKMTNKSISSVKWHEFEGVKDDMHDIMDAMKRLEDKLDKILMGSR